MTQTSAEAIAPDLRLIEQLARDAVVNLPEPYREAATLVVLRVEDLPEQDLVEAMGCDSPYDLTGLYEGIPMTEKSVSHQPQQPDVIWLFRKPILEEWIDRGDVSLGDLVTHVMIHELAHHFGWSDEDIASVDPWWE